MSNASLAPDAAPSASPPNATAPAAEAPLLERLGVGYLQRLAAKGPPPAAGDAVHVLNAAERASLRAIERGAIARAFLAGALSATAAGVAEVLATPLLGPDPDHPARADLVKFWLVVGPVIAVAAVCEISFLYWDGLRSVHRLAHAAGVRLFPEEPGQDSQRMAAVLARAALELPNPTAEAFGVDPRREASRLRLLAASLLYKARVGLSNFIAKALIRRALGRSLVRAWLSFVAVPITGFWDAMVCARVMREARIRAMGPSAVHELLEAIFGGAGPLSPTVREQLVRAVGSSIVRTFDLHPNHVALLRGVRARLGEPPVEAPDDSRRFLAGLHALGRDEQALVLRVLSVAAIIDGRLVGSEVQLVREALRACGRPDDAGPLRALRTAFLRGDPIPAEALRALA